MADLSFFLTNGNVLLGQNMEAEGRTEFETVEITECTAGKVKVPRRIIHFANGDIMEEFSTDDDEEEEQKAVKQEVVAVDTTLGFPNEMLNLLKIKMEDFGPLSNSPLLFFSLPQSKLTWGPYFWFHMWRVATSTISVCDFMGEKLASLFGITTPKYQYAIDEYYRIKKEKEEEEEENRLAEEAERTFAAQRRWEQENPAAVKDQPEGSGASFVNVSFELEPESSLRNPDPNRVPSPLPS